MTTHYKLELRMKDAPVSNAPGLVDVYTDATSVVGFAKNKFDAFVTQELALAEKVCLKANTSPGKPYPNMAGYTACLKQAKAGIPPAVKVIVTLASGELVGTYLAQGWLPVAPAPKKPTMTTPSHGTAKLDPRFYLPKSSDCAELAYAITNTCAALKQLQDRLAQGQLSAEETVQLKADITAAQANLAQLRALGAHCGRLPECDTVRTQRYALKPPGNIVSGTPEEPPMNTNLGQTMARVRVLIESQAHPGATATVIDESMPARQASAYHTQIADFLVAARAHVLKTGQPVAMKNGHVLGKDMKARLYLDDQAVYFSTCAKCNALAGPPPTDLFAVSREIQKWSAPFALMRWLGETPPLVQKWFGTADIAVKWDAFGLEQQGVAEQNATVLESHARSGTLGAVPWQVAKWYPSNVKDWDQMPADMQQQLLAAAKDAETKYQGFLQTFKNQGACDGTKPGLMAGALKEKLVASGADQSKLDSDPSVFGPGECAEWMRIFGASPTAADAAAAWQTGANTFGGKQIPYKDVCPNPKLPTCGAPQPPPPAGCEAGYQKDASGNCVPIGPMGCKSAADCPPGQTCLNGECQPTVATSSSGSGIGLLLLGAAVVGLGFIATKGDLKSMGQAPRLENPKRVNVTKALALNDFRAEVLPSVVKRYGSNDRVAIREAWNDYTDGLHKAGYITRAQVDSWSNPF